MGPHATRLVHANVANSPLLHHRAQLFVVCHFWFDTTTVHVIKATTVIHCTAPHGVNPGHSGLPTVHRGKGLVDCTGSRSGVVRGKGHDHNLGRPLKTGCTPVLRALTAIYSVTMASPGKTTSSDPAVVDEASSLGGNSGCPTPLGGKPTVCRTPSLPKATPNSCILVAKLEPCKTSPAVVELTVEED